MSLRQSLSRSKTFISLYDGVAKAYLTVRQKKLLAAYIDRKSRILYHISDSLKRNNEFQMR